MSVISTIAIDGPAASGKSTLGKKLADKLGYLFFDTGLMYRALTWAALRDQLELSNETAVSNLAATIEIDIRTPSQADGRNCDILVNGEDVTWEVRSPEVDANVSVVSAYPDVRTAMMVLQRRIGHRGRVVMVGRDIGTVVMPDANIKFYLDASLDERARRRYEELLLRGQEADLHEITQAMRLRDQIDSTRQVAPLRPAEDAIILNSDELEADQVLQQVLDLVKSHNSRSGM